MRPLAVALSVLLLATGCGGDGGERAAPALSRAEAQAIVDRALLDVDDLGAGWELTDTVAPGEEDEGDEANPLDACVPEDEIEADDLAESEERTFSRAGEIIPAELAVSAGATADPARLDRFHEIIASDDFQACLTEAFEAEMRAQTEVDLRLGDIDDERGIADVEGVRSTRLRIPIEITADVLSLAAKVDIVVVTGDQVGAALFAFGPEDGVTDDDIARWSTLLGERLRST